MKFYTAKRFMTKEEILQELKYLKEAYMLDWNHFVIIDDAAKILNGIEPNITYDTDTKPKNVDIWVDPKYYDYLLNCEGYLECLGEDIYIGYAYANFNGAFRLHRGKGTKPKSKRTYGYNVQICDAESKSKMQSTVTNFRVVK